MSLALRLQIAFGLLALVAAAVIGTIARHAWQKAESERFEEQFEAATVGVSKELEWEASQMGDLLQSTCDHDGDIDQTAMDAERHALSTDRRLSISLLAKDQMKALHLDELLLFTGTGEILGSGHDPAETGKVDKTLVAEPSARLAVRAGTAEHKAALVARCSHRFASQVIYLVGARHLDAILNRIGEAYGVKLSVAGPLARVPGDDEESRQVTARFSGVGGLSVVASISRAPLEQHLRMVDRWVVSAAAATIVLAVVVASFWARSLARPLEQLARQAGEVTTGEPRPVHAKGTREIEEFARAYNRAIEDLVKLRKRLATTERIAARREIARRVAHEIKNPLAPIRAAVETLRRLRARGDQAFDEYFDEATTTVLSEVHRITKIVSEFTEFARLPAPNPTRVNLEEVARSTVALYATGGAEVSLKSSACPEIRADRDQLVQVLTNLIQNGLDAAAGQDRTAKVEVEVRPAGDARVAIRVADNGSGVSEDMLPRLFEPYATNKPAGTGLGLAIVQRIVHEHGGEITYEKGPLGGALFRVILPVTGPFAPATSGDEPAESQPVPRG